MSFHVPVRSRITDHPLLGTTDADGNNGAFRLPSPEPGWTLVFICSDGTERPEQAEYQWEHVSVHAADLAEKRLRTPTWKEMCFIKDACWDDEDVVMQLHPKRSEYVNNHPFTLHLWRPTFAAIPTPPSDTVGIRGAGVMTGTRA